MELAMAMAMAMAVETKMGMLYVDLCRSILGFMDPSHGGMQSAKCPS